MNGKVSDPETSDLYSRKPKTIKREKILILLNQLSFHHLICFCFVLLLLWQMLSISCLNLHRQPLRLLQEYGVMRKACCCSLYGRRYGSGGDLCKAAVTSKQVQNLVSTVRRSRPDILEKNGRSICSDAILSKYLKPGVSISSLTSESLASGPLSTITPSATPYLGSPTPEFNYATPAQRVQQAVSRRPLTTNNEEDLQQADEDEERSEEMEVEAIASELTHHSAEQTTLGVVLPTPWFYRHNDYGIIVFSPPAAGVEMQFKAQVRSLKVSVLAEMDEMRTEISNHYSIPLPRTALASRKLSSILPLPWPIVPHSYKRGSHSSSWVCIY